MQQAAVLGHDRVLERFRCSMLQDRLASTFLFLGPPGVGKRTTALHIAQCLLCESTAPNQLVACQDCPGCQQVAARSHPDLILITKPDDKNFIPVETFIGDRQHRMREGLCHDISLKPFRGGRKVAIIDDADYLNQEGANCLLKTLEEPPHKSVIILIGTSQHRQLPTIRSRCQIVRFAPLADEIVDQLLASHFDYSAEQRAALVPQAAGSLSRAVELADTELAEAQQELLQHLTQTDFDATAVAKSLTAFVDAVSKDAAPHRARLRQVVRGTAEFYRELMRQSAAAPPSSDHRLAALASDAHRQWPGGATTAAACVQRCLEATYQIDANANLTTLIYCWIDDLAQLAQASDA